MSKPIVVVSSKGVLVKNIDKVWLLTHLSGLIKELTNYETIVYRYQGRNIKKTVVAGRFIWFSTVREQLRVNIAFKDLLFKYLEGTDYELVNLAPFEGEDADIKMVDSFELRDDNQIKFVDFLTSQETNSRFLPAIMGSGKTVCTLKALSIIKKKALICIAPKFIHIWESAIEEFTELDKNDYTVIQGKKALYDLIENGNDNKIVIISSTTLQNYLNDYKDNKDFDAPCIPDDLFETLGFGVKVVDEAHLFLKLNAIIDSFSNINRNISLSGTLLKATQFLKRMESLLHPLNERCSVPKPEKFVDLVSVKYGFYKKPNVVGLRGYSHFALEKQIEKTKKCTNNYFEFIMDIYRKYGDGVNKALVYFGKTSMVKAFVEYFSGRYEDLSVSEYIADSDDGNLNSDVIITTQKKTGVGTDIKNLQLVIQTISLKSTEENRQNFGRLRKIDKVAQYFVYIYSDDISSHKIHHRYRQKIFKDLCKSSTDDLELFKFID